MTASDRLRIGDQERESAAAALGLHFSTGRLTREELDERSRLALEARTAADLRPLFADLPLPHGPLPTARTASSAPPASPASPGSPGWSSRGRPRGRRFPWVPVVVALVVLSMLTHLPWVLFGLLAWAVWSMVSRGGGCGAARTHGRSAHRAWSHGS